VSWGSSGTAAIGVPGPARRTRAVSTRLPSASSSWPCWWSIAAPIPRSRAAVPQPEDCRDPPPKHLPQGRRCQPRRTRPSYRTPTRPSSAADRPLSVALRSAVDRPMLRLLRRTATAEASARATQPNAATRPALTQRARSREADALRAHARSRV
jgi:hypothetical protein